MTFLQSCNNCLDENKRKENEHLMAILDLKDKEIKEMIVNMQQKRMAAALRTKNVKVKKEKKVRKPSKYGIVYYCIISVFFLLRSDLNHFKP